MMTFDPRYFETLHSSLVVYISAQPYGACRDGEGRKPSSVFASGNIIDGVVIRVNKPSYSL